MARKPPALARELLRNFPKRRARGNRRRRNKGGIAAGVTAKNGVAQRQIGRSGVGRGAQAPSEAVLDEALAREAVATAPAVTDGNGAGLGPAAEGELERDVAEALEHAGE